MLLAMSFHILSGVRLFCANELLRPFRTVGVEVGALAVTAPEPDSAQVSGAPPENRNTQSGASRCNCKNQKKCPAIPRTAIISNPTNRFGEFERQAKSVCSGSLALDVTDNGFLEARDTPFRQLACSGPLRSSTPLALSCVLLI